MSSISSRAADICDEFELKKEELEALLSLTIAIERSGDEMENEDISEELGSAYNSLIELITKYGYDIDRGQIVKMGEEKNTWS